MAGSVSVASKPHAKTTQLEVYEEMDQELSRFELLVLTCTLGGLQVVWSILNGNINVFLLSIGIPTSISPLIWVIAPLCGTIVQPIVGWMSDQSNNRFGRRKPFVLIGTITTIASLLGLSWSQNFARAISADSNELSVTTAIAVIWTVLLNISIQPLQMGIRALVMDGCPKAQQPQANAWAGCAASVGNVFGYLVSFTAASRSIHVFGFGHFKYLASIASCCLIATVAFNLWLSEETQGCSPQSSPNKVSFRSILHHLRHANLVSSRTRIINRIQFCAWMGWFPFLFYMTSFVSGLSIPQEPDKKSKSQSGALAGFLYALISCLFSLLIPHLLTRTKYAAAEIKASSASPIATLLGLSLEQVWCAGQIFFAVLMFSTIFASTPSIAVALIACAGIPWALANYIPFALLGVEVAEQRSLRENISLAAMATDEGQDTNENIEQISFGTGATIGLHNAAISAPQIVAALVSAAVLAASGKFEIQDGIGWVMRLSGCAALGAAWQIRRLFTR